MVLLTLLLLSAVVSVCCHPIYSSMFNIGCSQFILHQDLNIEQALNPNFNSHVQFGYIYAISGSGMAMNADIPIRRFDPSNTRVPSKAVAVLSGVSYNELGSKLILTSRISKQNANSLNLDTLDAVNIKFGTFAYDKARKEWHSSLKNGNLGGITGRVAKANILHQKNGQDSHFEFVLELVPVKDADKIQSLNYTVHGVATDLQIKWDRTSACQKFNNRNIISNRRDYFNEVIESAVLL